METCFKILQLKFDKKLTNRCIGLTLHISASTVFEVLARFKASSLSWPLPADISHDTLEKLIYPPKDTSASELVMPDMLYFDTETLRFLIAWRITLFSDSMAFVV